MAKKLSYFGLVMVLLPALCFATNFGGEWGNSLYFMQDRLDTLRPLTSGFENLNLHATNINGSNVSLFTNLNATNGFTDSTRKKVEVDHLYLDWRNIGGLANARIGRQTVYEGFKVKNFDGAKIDALIAKNFTVSGFGGLTVPSKYSSSYVIVNPDSSLYRAGAKAAFHLPTTDAALLFEDEARKSGPDKNGIGLDLAQSMGKTASLRASGVYGLTEKSIDNYRVRCTVEPSEKLALEASVYVDKEAPDTVSLFKAFNIFKPYTQTSATATWFFCDKASLSGGYVLRLFDGAGTCHEVEVRYDHTCFSAGFIQDIGYGGSNSQLDLCVRLFGRHPLQLEAGGTGMMYTTELLSKSQLAYIGRAALVYHPSVSWLNARLEVQQLHNMFYASDTRVLLTTQIRFSKFTAQ